MVSTNGSGMTEYRLQKPLTGACIRRLLRDTLDCNWYQDQALKLNIGGVVATVYQPTSLEGMQLVSYDGNSDLIHPDEMYIGIIVPERFVPFFLVLPGS